MTHLLVPIRLLFPTRYFYQFIQTQIANSTSLNNDVNTMVLTAAQTTAFFEDAAQMAIPHDTVLQLQTEGITTVDDLEDFDDDDIDQVSSNLRRPPGGVGAFTFGAKSQKRLLLACHLVRYYNTVGRTLTAANMQ